MITALEFIKDDAKKIGNFIADTLVVYAKRGDYLVYGGAISFYHAAQHGDPVFVQRLFDGLSKGHQNLFRSWVGKLCVYEDGDKRDQWLSIKDGKFLVKPQTEKFRKDKYLPDDLLASGEWFKRVRDPEPKLSDDEVLGNLMTATIEAVTKQAAKRWDKAGVLMPVSVKKLIDQFEADMRDIAKNKAAMRKRVDATVDDAPQALH